MDKIVEQIAEELLIKKEYVKVQKVIGNIIWFSVNGCEYSAMLVLKNSKLKKHSIRKE